MLTNKTKYFCKVLTSCPNHLNQRGARNHFNSLTRPCNIAFPNKIIDHKQETGLFNQESNIFNAFGFWHVLILDSACTYGFSPQTNSSKDILVSDF